MNNMQSKRQCSNGKRTDLTVYVNNTQGKCNLSFAEALPELIWLSNKLLD